MGTTRLLYSYVLRLQERRWGHVYAAFLMLTYCVFPAVSQTIFQVFSCDSDFDDGEEYLRLDYAISCTSDKYRWRGRGVWVPIPRRARLSPRSSTGVERRPPGTARTPS